MEQIGDVSLAAFQVEFIHKFLAPDSPPFHQLVAPTGTGKTAVAIAIIGEVAASSQANRVLVLVPALALGDYIVYQLQERTGDIPVEWINQRTYRELVARVPVGASPWPASIVAVMTLQLAAREDIAESLTTVDWDLVLVDDAHALVGSRWGEVIARLLRAGVVRRLLLTTAILPPKPYSFPIPELETTRWHRRLVAEGQQAEVRFAKVIEYQRTPEELDFLHRLRELIALLQDFPPGIFMRTLFVRAASSSLYAIGGVLRRVRNRLAHGSVSSMFESGSEHEDQPTMTDILRDMSSDDSTLWKDPGTALAAADEAIEGLDLVPEDAKLQALLTRLKGPSFEETHRHVGVFASFAGTVSYLEVALKEAGLRVYGLTGELSYEERASLSSQFDKQGGILVATFAGIHGIRIRFPTAIFYDLPQSSDQMAQILGDLGTSAQYAPPEVHVLRDLSGAIQEETDLLRLHGFAD